MRGLTRLLLLLALSYAAAYRCSDSEQQTGYGLFRAAAARSGCAPYASTSGSTVTINWSCRTTSCLPTMMQLASQLPNCESQVNGKNARADLEYSLYSQCKLCTFDQQDQVAALWKSAAATTACSPYTTPGGTWFSWPCSATGCTSVIKDLAYKVPDCVIDSQNERNRILEGISACTSGTPSTQTPSPTSTSSTATSSPSTTTPRTSSPWTSAPSNSDGSGMCTDVEIKYASNLWLAAASTSSCSKYSSVNNSYVEIAWPCSASGCNIMMGALAEKLPSCLNPGESTTEKSRVANAVENCNELISNGNSDATSTPAYTSSPGYTSTPTYTSSPSYSSAPSTTGSYSSGTCSTTEVKETITLYYDVANSTECKSYSTVTSSKITITAPCTSSCVTRGFQSLADSVPDCYYSYDLENKKEQLNEELEKCQGRRLSAEASSGYVTITIYSQNNIKDVNKAPAAPTTIIQSGVLSPSLSATSMVVALALGVHNVYRSA